MNEIICPHCHKAFKVDEAGYVVMKIFLISKMA